MKTTLELGLDRVPSPIGRILLVWDATDRLVALDFETHEDRMLRLLRLHHDATWTLSSASAPASIARPLEAFFSGALDAVESVPVRTGGTAFEQRVWEGLRRIPAGTTASYGQLAAAIGCPGASRAVGRANGANAVGIVIPCHRVIGANGTLTGYGGGLERKRWLLAHEQRKVTPFDASAIQVASA